MATQASPNPQATGPGPAPRLETAASRALLGAGLGGVLHLLDLEPVATLHGIQSLEVGSVASFLAGQLFGPAGAFGNAIAALLFRAAQLGRLPSPFEPLANLALGLFAWAVLRYLPGIRVRIDTFRAYMLFLATAAVGALGYSALEVEAVFPGAGMGSVGVWWTGALTSLVLLVPALAELLARLAARWALPQALGVKRALRGRELAGPIVTVLALTLALGWLGGLSPTAVSWLVILYLFPILWAALTAGLQGGVIAASLVGLCYLQVQEPTFSVPELWHGMVVGEQAVVLGFSLFGAIAGRARHRELELRQQLEEANVRLRGSLESVVRALRSALHAKDAYTEGHVGRVSAFACATGRRLGMSDREVDLLEVASLLHDVGKIGIPEQILHKPGPLSEEEIEVMREHPRIGARMLQDLEWLEAAAPLVLHHQERYDGRTEGRFPGYPEGLKGEQIPLGARIVAVVDAFDAMTSDRSYRQALSVDEAVEILNREAGGQFDPKVVEAFLALLSESPW